jgi:hypothetical protein
MINTLYKIGLGVLYELIIKTIIHIVELNKKNIKEKASRQPQILSYENMNYNISVQTMLIYKQSNLQSNTTAYVYFLLKEEYRSGSLPVNQG